MQSYWEEMTEKEEGGKLGKEEKKIFKKLIKSLYHLSKNPKHSGLCTHEIKPLTQKMGIKIWQSYLENKTPAAGRIFWAYGPNKNQITILGIEPHPEDKKQRGYVQVKLSKLPEEKD